MAKFRLPVIGGLVRVIGAPSTAPANEAITNLQAAVTALNAAVQTLQTPVVTPGSFSQPPTGTVKVTATKGASPAFMASDSAPAADPSILVHRGRRGDDGIDGRPGRPGLAGVAGAAGKAGVSGRRGEDGETGRVGPPGAAGAAGVAGAAGSPGATGRPGREGQQGDDGRRGGFGATGAAGAVGVQGVPGVAVVREGVEGEQGRRGVPGLLGLTGPTGPTGPIGPVGLGARGLQGDPGEDGRQGVPGPLGQTGLTGTTGIQGAPGVSVVREGIEGEQGRRGVQGLVGAPGAQGVPGVAAHRPYHDEPHMFGRQRVFDPRNIDGPVHIINAGPANALNIASGVSAWGISIVSPNNAGLSYGMLITAGTSGADVALQVRSAVGTNLLLVYGDGSGFLGYATPGAVFTWNAAGAVTVNAPASGLQFNIQDANGYGVYASQEDSLNFNYGRNSTSDGYINYHGYADGVTQFRSLNICNGKAGQLARFDATGIPLTLYGNNEVLQLNTNVARGSGQNYLEFDDPSGLKGYVGYGSGTNDNFYIYNSLANMVFFTSAGLVMTLSGALGTGAVQATAGVLSTVSDERAKNNIHPFTHGLAEILKLKPILHGYDKKLSGIDTPRTDYPGFSAQNVQGAIPEAVEAGADGMLSLSDRGILAALVNAVQELAARI